MSVATPAATMRGRTPARLGPELPAAALLLVLAALSVIPLAILIVHAARHNVVFSGADGPFPADQFQYMSWIQQFGTGVLAANGFDITPSARVFLHPMFFLSGLLWRLGVSVQLAYLLWTPAAIAALFVGFRAYVWRFFTATPARIGALAIALFYSGPVSPIATWASLGSASLRNRLAAGGGELLPGTDLWGQLPTAISVGLLPLYLLGAEWLAFGAVRRRRAAVALVSLCGAAVSWLHPWQGEVMLIVVVVAVALGRCERRYRVLVVPAAAGLAPLLYYFVLSRADSAWHLAQTENAGLGHVGLWPLLVVLLPLLVPAAFGVRAAVVDFRERMLRVWPLAAIAVYAVFSPSFPQHALEGLSLPLGILAVRGIARLRRHAALALALFATVVTVPGLVQAVRTMHSLTNANQQAFYLHHGERRALSYLARGRPPGGVLATPFLGPLVPPLTGRQTWVGHPSWTEHYFVRASRADALFDGRLARPAAYALVRSSHARFLLDDCQHPSGAALGTLRPIVSRVRRFGCATVYELSRGRAARA